MTKKPGDVVHAVENAVVLPIGTEERFAGYGIMGLPFASGHVLALRRFPASSIGSSYTSVWHRDPAGNWVFYADVDPGLACSRYFGNALVRSERAAIALTWIDSRRLTIEVPAAELSWALRVAANPTTRLLNGLAAALPAPLWQRPTTLAAMARVAGWALGAGRLSLLGCTPNGQRFRANPRQLWVVDDSRARIGGVDLGVPGAITPQAYLGDFMIPQRGVFVVGAAFFETGCA